MRIDCMACYTLPMRPGKMLLVVQVKVFYQRQQVVLISKCTALNLSHAQCYTTRLLCLSCDIVCENKPQSDTIQYAHHAKANIKV